MHPRKVQEFLAHTSCYQCGEDLKAATLNTLVETPLAHIVHISCPKCQAEILATITVSGTGVMRITTDLQPEELNRFLSRDPVSGNELLNAYELLEKESLWNLLATDASPTLTAPALRDIRAQPSKSAEQAASPR